MSPDVDEETPLLSQSTTTVTTPLPWVQLSIVLLIQLAEPLTSNVINPFAPQVVRDIGITHGDETQVGHYVGLMISAFYFTQAMTILHWGKLSDRIGRKPVILLGLFGISLSMACFGVSRTFGGLMLSRCISGALSGNVSVIKSMMTELTDVTNIAQAFAYYPIPWAVGSILGPVIGGTLSRPAEQFPSIFGTSWFFIAYPYFLACAVPAAISAIFCLLVFFFLNETVPHPTPISRILFGKQHKKGGYTSRVHTGIKHVARYDDDDDDDSGESKVRPASFRELLTYRVLIASGNYALLALCDISFKSIQPVFLSTPPELGGLGLTPAVIGKVLSVFSIGSGVFQAFAFARVHSWLGSKRTYLVGVSGMVLAFATFPVVSVIVRRNGEVGLLAWVAVLLQAAVPMSVNLSYGVIYLYIAASSPNRASMGATTGLGQMAVSIFRTIGPAAATSLYSLSLSQGYMGGFMVYYVLMVVAVFSIMMGTLLPSKLGYAT